MSRTNEVNTLTSASRWSNDQESYTTQLLLIKLKFGKFAVLAAQVPSKGLAKLTMKYSQENKFCLLNMYFGGNYILSQHQKYVFA